MLQAVLSRRVPTHILVAVNILGQFYGCSERYRE